MSNSSSGFFKKNDNKVLHNMYTTREPVKRAILGYGQFLKV